MADISNKTLGVVVGLALVVSLVGLFSLPNGGLLGVTGFGSTGEARVNITTLAALNVTQTVIDFGNGTVTQGTTNCTLASDITGDPNNCFTPSYGSDGPQSGGLNVVNVGNVNINVTITALKNGSLSSGATSFWGVTGGKYLYRCAGNGTIDQSTYVSVNNIAGQVCVSNLSAGAGSDGFTTHINITIPETATGYKNDTLTFFASQT